MQLPVTHGQKRMDLYRVERRHNEFVRQCMFCGKVRSLMLHDNVLNRWSCMRCIKGGKDFDTVVQ